jgi:hypothetical protein
VLIFTTTLLILLWCTAQLGPFGPTSVVEHAGNPSLCTGSLAAGCRGADSGSHPEDAHMAASEAVVAGVEAMVAVWDGQRSEASRAVR